MTWGDLPIGSCSINFMQYCSIKSIHGTVSKGERADHLFYKDLWPHFKVRNFHMMLLEINVMRNLFIGCTPSMDNTIFFLRDFLYI